MNGRPGCRTLIDGRSLRSLLPHPDNAPPAPSAAPSFDDVYAEHFPFVWRCLRTLGVDPHALDDAVQEVFLAVHRQLGNFRGESTVRTWLFGIVRNVAANQRRSALRRGARLQALEEDVPSSGPGPLDRMQELQAAAFVGDFVARLDAGRRDLFVMVLLEEIPVPEAAAALGMGLNTAYTRIRRLRAAFGKALAKREEKT